MEEELEVERRREMELYSNMFKPFQVPLFGWKSEIYVLAPVCLSFCLI
jgi:hypothetical protein